MGVVYAFSFANSERSMTPMRFDDHRKIVGTGFNTDPRDATEPDGRHAGIPFVVGARRVSAAVAGTDQEVHSYVFMLQVDKHERCSLEVLLAMPDWASISGDGSVHQEASANSDAYSAAVMQERSLAFVREVVLGASNRTCGRGMHCTCSSCCRKRYHLQRRDAQSSAVCKGDDVVFVTPRVGIVMGTAAQRALPFDNPRKAIAHLGNKWGSLQTYDMTGNVIETVMQLETFYDSIDE